MPIPRIDANIVLRYLTGEPPIQAEQATRLFQRISAGEVRVRLEEIVLAEAVWTLLSFYRNSRYEIAEWLLGILAHDGIEARDKGVLRQALMFFRERNVSFADSLLAAHMLANQEHEIYSFDRDFDRIPGITRLELG
jgi:predicted nucleic acid-binding protein